MPRPSNGVVLATGDLAPDRSDVASCFAATAAILREAELTFGQLETSFAAGGTRLPQARHAVLADPVGAEALAAAGYNVISCAGNHCLDWGPGALLETIGHLDRAGISVIGAGADIRSARRPFVAALADGTRVAWLAYCSILPADYWATDRRAGCAPMRALTLYEQIEPDQPGTPARTHSYAHREDLAAMQADIRAARESADVVLVSLHWGIHFVRAQIADYQREVARAAVSAGADAILGHHAHILKGLESIDGRPVLYSLCNFATDLRMDPEHASRPSFKEIQALARGWEPDFGSLYNFPPDSRWSAIARLHIAKGRIRETALLPVFIGRDAVPHLLDAADPRFGEVRDYLAAVTREAGLNGRLLAAENRLVLDSGV
ncbi:MAG TPA: CapA family protein [Steroidobacteraceae bacterium]|jgi:poly-gamma-glutamate synthesis protein (capsule biosynthesis protein)|nr:CapA family protein [Steroidobacteraceae bacterium]